jgi:hypothetical protein
MNSKLLNIMTGQGGVGGIRLPSRLSLVGKGEYNAEGPYLARQLSAFRLVV